jgi:uncharacterized damage-inducible protein DinB
MALLEAVRMFVQYSCDANRQLWESVMRLSDEQFVAETAHSHGSIRNLMVHISFTEAGWLAGLKGEMDTRRSRPPFSAYTTRAEAFALWEEKTRTLLDYVAGLDEATLQSTPPEMNLTVWQVLLHLVNHGTDHRSQVLRALHDLGAPTFEQDFIFYVWRNQHTDPA